MNSDLTIVILAGPGHRMYPLINNGNNDEGLIKCLLPIGGKPMIVNLMSHLQGLHCGQVLIVTNSRSVSKLSNVVRNFLASTPNNTLEVQIIDEGECDSLEECSPMRALRAAKNRIRGDFVLLPCDLTLFTSNQDSESLFVELFNSLADFHRLKNSLLTMMLLKDSENKTKETKEDASTDKVLTAFYKTDDGHLQLLKLTGVCDLEDNLTIKLGLLERYPRIRFSSNLLDPFWTIFAYETLELLEEPVDSSEWSIREDFIPKVIRHSLRNNQCCLLKIVPTEAEVLFGRVYNVQALADVNRQFAIKYAPTNLVKCPVSCECPGKSALSTDVLLGEHCRIGEKALVKRSVLGSHVTVGVGAKLVNNFILDNVSIGEGCKIDNCIIGPRVTIHGKAVLKDCCVAPGAVISGDTNFKGITIGLASAKQLDDLFD